MKIQLEELEYQHKAINSIVRVFEGQPRNTLENSVFYGIKTNVLNLTQEQINNNKKRIIADNGLTEDLARLSDDNDYCIEMETGTGKTLVYIRSIYELHQQYGWTKFIILVPSIAIRQGVINTLQIFEEQLRDLYGFKIPYFEYSSKSLAPIRHFIDDTQPQIIVMTIQSFSSDDRIINQQGRDDAILGMSYIQALGKTQPVMIMDEPQEGMDTENSIERIAQFNPICKLRYSATHKVVKNLLYRLSPYDAYQAGMVKKIAVLSVAEKHHEATMRLEVSRVDVGKGRNPRVKLMAWRNMPGGFGWKETGWLSQGDDLLEKTSNSIYAGYRIERVSKGIRDPKFKVEFSNGVALIEKERDTDLAGLFRQQLYWLIRTHFQKKRDLSPKGIKCLSLVFIDRVDNYVADDGIIRRLFHEEYRRVFQELFSQEPSEEEIIKAQGYYFAKTTAGSFTDSEASMRNNTEIFDTILRDKEALLSFDNPIEFIFSHSALGVGWDNPNVFNIATLNQSYSEIKKRQEIGRGLRICLNQDGHRVYDPQDIEEGSETNLLTVVPNETSETFVRQYQEEIREVYGTTDAGSHIREIHPGQDSATIIKRNEENFKSREFREFWQKLAQKTDYVIAINEEKLIERAIEALNTIAVSDYEVEIVLARIRSLYEDAEIVGHETEKLRATFSPLDLVEELSENTSLSYPTTLKIVQRLTNLAQVIKNPPEFVRKAAEQIRKIELEEMLRGLSYHPTGESLSLSEFKETLKTYLPTQDTPTRGIYDKVICDSNSKPEREFAGAADSDSEIVCFLKLPSAYEIPTPVGCYRPDFGLVVKRSKLRSEEKHEYYFVVETKGTNDINDISALTESEKYKIECAQKHFAAIGLNANIDYQIYFAPIREYQRDFKDRIPS